MNALSHWLTAGVSRAAFADHACDIASFDKGSLHCLLLQIPGAATWAALRSLAKASNARYIVGLKLSGGHATFIKAFHQRAEKELQQHVLSYELGNEPEYWPPVSGQKLPTGGWLHGQFKPGFGPYVTYFQGIANTLTGCPAAGRNPILLGPGWHSLSQHINITMLSNFIAAGKCYLKEVSARNEQSCWRS